jgi:tRNA(Ile)-lysidine synthase
VLHNACVADLAIIRCIVISNLVSRVRNEVERALTSPPEHAFATNDAGTGLLLAVSGGPDSICLADATLAIVSKCGLRPVIAHLDHGLRGQAGRDDAEFVRTFAAERGVPALIEAADVPAIARDRRLSLEVAARQARYAFLARAAGQAGALQVALAHHADDQAETVLLRLLRGTGPAGLRGMQLRSPLPGATQFTAVRPLLRITRGEIERYCHDQNLRPRHDATNDELHHARNRIRHELLPALERYNPNIRAVLARLADTMASDLEIVEHATLETFERIAHVSDATVQVDRRTWRGLVPGLQREILREAVRRLKGDTTDLPYAAIEEARDVLNSDAGTGEIALMRDVRITVAWPVYSLEFVEWPSPTSRSPSAS